MQLGLSTGYWGAGPPNGIIDKLAEAERLGFDSFWTAESYGSDALTPLAWWGASTSRLRLATGIMQMSARTPAATAMAAITMDHLSGGRFILGLGVSGPQVVEGWYGQQFGKPLARTREYIAIVRAIIARNGPVEFAGEYYTLPLRGGTGLGKPLKSTVHPLRRDIPIVLGAEGPRNVALAAEIADGWISMFYAPRHDRIYREALAEGFARPGARHNAADFEIFGLVPIVSGADIDACADAIRPILALYIGGMGARGRNFHRDVFARMGYEETTETVQELYLAGRKAEAAAAIPTSLVEEIALIGPPAKLREEIGIWTSSLLTTMLVTDSPEVMRLAVELVA